MFFFVCVGLVWHGYFNHGVKISAFLFVQRLAIDLFGVNTANRIAANYFGITAFNKVEIGMGGS